MSRIGSNADWVTRSLASVWHPCTQMKHHERFPLVPVVRGEGAWLIDADGNRLFDAVSSWWVNLFGHANPRINAALQDQLNTLEHAMLAGFTHGPVVELSERLAKLSGLGHAFYGSDGASAVEIALKMSFHSWRNRGLTRKQKFISLAGSYHGETLGALSVTDVAIFRDAYGPLLAQNITVPTPSIYAQFGAKMPEKAHAAESYAFALQALRDTLERQHDEVAALIIEPLVQGASGMRMYAPEYLHGARTLCDEFNVHLIVDEIMTGFGRTGSMFAHQQANIRPDLMCLSKGITGGYLPLSCVLSSDDIYQSFYDDDAARGFLHSHSYTGSALACRAALATLDIFDEDDVLNRNRAKAERFTALAAPLANHPSVQAARHLGMIWAFDVDGARPEFARECFARGLARGILLRPIGRTVYFMPPYITSEEEFSALVANTVSVLDEVCAHR